MKSKVQETLGGASNPKYAAGLKKANLSHVSSQVVMCLAYAIQEIGSRPLYDYAVCNVFMPNLYTVALGMMEGSIKYGRHNYRASSVNADTYYGATGRHVVDWFYKEDIDSHAAGNLHHIGKAMSSLNVILDSIVSGKLIDDRPIRINTLGFFQSFYFKVPKKLKASTAYAEIMYHLFAWWEGEKYDRRSRKKTHHLFLAMAWMHELLYAIAEGHLVDDRPCAPREKHWMNARHASAVELLEARGDKPIAEPFTQGWAEKNNAKIPSISGPVVAPVIRLIKQKPRRMTVKRSTTRMKKAKKTRKH